MAKVHTHAQNVLAAATATRQLQYTSTAWSSLMSAIFRAASYIHTERGETGPILIWPDFLSRSVGEGDFIHPLSRLALGQMFVSKREPKRRYPKKNRLAA